MICPSPPVICCTLWFCCSISTQMEKSLLLLWEAEACLWLGPLIRVHGVDTAEKNEQITGFLHLWEVREIFSVLTLLFHRICLGETQCFIICLLGFHSYTQVLPFLIREDSAGFEIGLMWTEKVGWVCFLPPKNAQWNFRVSVFVPILGWQDIRGGGGVGVKNFDSLILQNQFLLLYEFYSMSSEKSYGVANVIHLTLHNTEVTK